MGKLAAVAVAVVAGEAEVRKAALVCVRGSRRLATGVVLAARSLMVGLRWGWSAVLGILGATRGPAAGSVHHGFTGHLDLSVRESLPRRWRSWQEIVVMVDAVRAGRASGVCLLQ